MSTKIIKVTKTIFINVDAETPNPIIEDIGFKKIYEHNNATIQFLDVTRELV